MVDPEGRGGFELAAGHAAHVALSGSGRNPGRRGRGSALPVETNLAHLPAGPGELVAGKVSDRFFLVAPGAHDVRHVRQVGTAGSRRVRALYDDGDDIPQGDFIANPMPSNEKNRERARKQGREGGGGGGREGGGGWREGKRRKNEKRHALGRTLNACRTMSRT